MFKDTVTQFNNLCPMECLKDFIHEKLFDLAIAGKKLEKIAISDFTQLEIDFMTGCLIAHDDYAFDFLYEAHAYMDVKKSVVKFMLNPENYIQRDFFLITQIKTIAVNHYREVLRLMIDDLKIDVLEDITEYFRVNYAKE